MTKNTTQKIDKAPALLKFGNLKLSKDIAVFNLPAVSTCGRKCPGCYALKAETRFPAVRAARARNKAAADAPEFVERVCAELMHKVHDGRGRVSAVRVHESGDFYSAAYVRKWVEIARRFSGLKFYAYTKRGGVSVLGTALRGLAALPNFTLINSLQYGPINYGDADYCRAMEKTRGAFVCPCGTLSDELNKKEGRKTCGGSCKYCQHKAAQEAAPVFLKH